VGVAGIAADKIGATNWPAKVQNKVNPLTETSEENRFMSSRITRRDFFKKSALGATVVAGLRPWDLPYIMAQGTPKAKIRTAVIGCGGQGTGAHVPPAAKENLVALIDADDNRIKTALKRAKDTNAALDETKVRAYADYRKFFDEMAKEVDAIFIATPNHHHALPALLAMQRGIAVYVEKPMAYDIHEARTMAEFSLKYKVATQMGNQGHVQEGYRRLVEYIQAGAIGNVTEVYSWCDRTNGGTGPRPPAMAPPAGLNWDSWIGPAPFREYHPDSIRPGKDGKPSIKHLHPHSWHGWHDFGGGSLGNMGAHVLDGAHWALDLSKPIAIEVEEVVEGSDERYPTGTRIRWDFAARGAMPPVKLYWYDGKRKGTKGTGAGLTDDAVGASVANVPALLKELREKYPMEKFESNGTLYVGDKGIMYTGTYGGGVRIVPQEEHKKYTAPPQKFDRLKGGPQADFLRGVSDPTYKPASNFVEAAKLTEMMLMGCTALRLPNQGVGTKVEWDGSKSTNSKEFNAMIKRDYRKGWEY
jgi:predicted dehydrogenase